MSTMSTGLAAQIANLALDTFCSLPQKYKPRTLPAGEREWTPLSAIALSYRQSPFVSPEQGFASGAAYCTKVVSMATGTKSLPVSALPKCNGLVLHDCHAEILAFRGFNYWLLCEIERLVKEKDYSSLWLEPCVPEKNDALSAGLPFKLRLSVEISLFATEAPCGDASMELLVAAAEGAGRDVRPWPIRTVEDIDSATTNKETKTLPPGRGFFSNLGALRRKPARADAEISMCKSCTDKLMLKQFTSVLSFPADLFIQKTAETFLKNFIVYEDQYCVDGYTRAFGSQGRLQGVSSRTEGLKMNNTRFFDVNTLPAGFRSFEFAKQKSFGKCKVSNLSALWIAGDGANNEGAVVEALVNGVKQGFKQFDAREGKGSAACRKHMVRKAVELGEWLLGKGYQVRWLDGLSSSQYSDFKILPVRKINSDLKQRVLLALGGWTDGVPKDDFSV